MMGKQSRMRAIRTIKSQGGSDTLKAYAVGGGIRLDCVLQDLTFDRATGYVWLSPEQMREFAAFLVKQADKVDSKK